MAVQGSYLNPREAARHLGLSVRTLCRYRSEGGGPAFHRFGGRILYLRGDLEDWAEAGRRSPVRGERRAGTGAVPAGRDAQANDGGGRPPAPPESGRPASAENEGGEASGRRVLNGREAAAHVGYRPDTLKGLRWKGEGPRWSSSGGRVVYDVRDLDAWVAARMRRVPAGAVGA